MATWPDTLPAPKNAGLSVTLGSNVLYRKTQSGRQEILRYGSGAPDRWKASFVFHGSQIAIFDSFFTNDLNLGVNWFSAPWISSKLGYANHLARIIGYPSEKIDGARMKEISVELLIKKSSACPADAAWPPIGD